MSLETEIANLTSKSTALIDYFNTRKGAIDSAVATAVAAIPNMERSWFVNQLTGQDSNPGTVAEPLRSIDKAIANTPVGGTCIVRLQSDYRHETYNLVVTSRVLLITSDTLGTKRKLICTYQSSVTSNASYLSGFGLTSGAHLGFRELHIALPSPEGITPVPGGTANALIKTYSAQVTGMISLKLDTCDITAADGLTASLLPNIACAVVFQSVGCSFPAGFAGRYIQGVVAGTASTSLSNLLTNHSTL